MVCSLGCYLKHNDVMYIHSLLPLKQFWFSNKNLSVKTPEDFSRNSFKQVPTAVVEAKETRTWKASS